MLTAICFRRALPGVATLIAVTVIIISHPGSRLGGRKSRLPIGRSRAIGTPLSLRRRGVDLVLIDPDARSAPAVNKLGTCTKRPIRVDGVRRRAVASRAVAARWRQPRDPGFMVCRDD
jgi:hypothetical protein